MAKATLALLGLIVAVCTAYQFFLFFKRPLEFWREHHVREHAFGGEWHPYKLRYVPFWGFVFGIGVCIFQGTQFALSWMPRNWVLADLWAPKVIAGVAAAFGTYALVIGMERFNSDIISGSLTREKILEIEKETAAK